MTAESVTGDVLQAGRARLSEDDSDGGQRVDWDVAEALHRLRTVAG